MRRSLFCVTFLLLPVAEACECSTPTLCELSRRATVIFTGKVVAGGVQSLREDPWYSTSRHVRLEVIEIFRGLAPGTKFVDMETIPPGGMCSPNPYRPGRTYLVSPYGSDGKWKDSGCFSGRDLADLHPSDLQILRRDLTNVRTPLKAYIRGRTAAVESDSDWSDYLPDHRRSQAPLRRSHLGLHPSRKSHPDSDHNVGCRWSLRTQGSRARPVQDPRQDRAL